jgi:carbamoyl-phosphate synthase large subunit
MRIYNVLVFPGGTEIGLEINKALCQCKNIRLFSAGLNISNHAPYVYKNHYCISSIYDKGWIDELNSIILDQDIDYVFPAYDDIIVALAQNANKIKARIISSPLETCLITRSKSATYRFFDGLLPVPILYTDMHKIDHYPVFVKPDKGQGSQNAFIVNSRDELLNVLNKKNDTIVMEYLLGEEYTIDCFSDREKGLLFSRGRQRIRIKNGISMNSRQFDDNSFIDFAKIINQNLPLYGAWFLQVKKDLQGAYKLLEIAPRIAGTMAFHRVQGINFPLLSLYEQERIPIEIKLNEIEIEIDRALINRYKHNLNFDTVYIDLDDTLVINNQVNTNLIKFIYQCLNNGKRMILLTKHNDDIYKTLKQFKVTEIFHEIIQLNNSDDKSKYIKNKAILIDDSFLERKNAFEKLNIPTFDCSMIEMLIDERVL